MNVQNTTESGDRTREVVNVGEASAEVPGLTTVDLGLALLSQFWHIVGMAVVGVLTAWAILELPEKNYRSAALVEIGSDTVSVADAIIRSPVVLDRISAQFPELARLPPEARYRVLNTKISWEVATDQQRHKATLFYFVVNDRQPARAQAVATALIDSWLELTKPRPDSRARLEVEIERAEAQLVSTVGLIRRFEDEAKTILAPNSIQGEIAGSLVRLIAEREGLVKTITQKKEALRGLSRDVIISPPTLPVEPGVESRRVRRLIEGGLIGAIVAALFILAAAVIEALRRAPTVDAKFRRAMAAVTLRKPKVQGGS